MSSPEPRIDTQRLDQLALENALLDVEVANARVTDLTQRLLEMSSELRETKHLVHDLATENIQLQATLAELRSNKAYRAAERVWQIRRGLGV